MSLAREYEAGAADVLAHLLGDEVTITRNTYLQGQKSGQRRQIDVLVQGDLFSHRDATLVVDAKRRTRRIDITQLEQFLGLLDDVSADLGLMVASSGYTSGAHNRARQQREVRLEVLTIDELRRWNPPGTFSVRFGIPRSSAEAAAAALRKSGLRVGWDSTLARAPEEVVVEAYRMPPAGDDGQRQVISQAEGALGGAQVEYRHASHGITIVGGTPAFRWLQITVAGEPTHLRVPAASELEAEEQLDATAKTLRLPRSEVDFIRPDDWPVAGLFGMTD